MLSNIRNCWKNFSQNVFDDIMKFLANIENFNLKLEEAASDETTIKKRRNFI